MATATKKTATKLAKTKTSLSETKEQLEEQDHEEKEGDVVPGKVKQPIEIDEPEVAVSIEDKIEEDPLLDTNEDDDLADDGGLDGEELNPFGDRWEE